MNRQETMKVEFKVNVDFNDWKNWLKTFCGFANSQGGEIWFGYNNNGIFVGIPEKDIDQIVRKINQTVRNHTYPILPYEIIDYPAEKEGYKGIRISVSKRSKCLNWLLEKDKTPELYIRHEGETNIANVEEMQDLLILTNKYEYDTISVGRPLEKISFEELSEEYSKNNSEDKLTNKMLKSFNLLTDNDQLTLAGYLLCDDTNCNEANIVCTTWPNNTKGTREIEDSKPFNGSLIKLIYSAIDYIQNVKYYSFGGIKKELHTIQNGSFAIESLREAIVNAFAHRDYHIRGNEIQINCFPDRIEITSPGSSLIGSYESESKKLESFPSHRRNKTICNALAKCRLMDEKGSGFDAILRDYEKFPEDYQPLYKSDRVSFTLILKNKKYNLKGTILKTTPINYHNEELMFKSRTQIFEENEKYEIIERLIQDNQFIGVDEIASELGITRNGAKYYISKMKNACLIRRVGGPKTGYYELVEDIDRPSDIDGLSVDIKNKLIEWCKKHFIQTNTNNSKHSSYKLKHIYEKAEKTYVTNGQFKAAMLLAGFSYKDNAEKNWHFNISEKSSALNLNIK